MKPFYNSNARMVICLVGPNTGQLKVLHHIDARNIFKTIYIIKQSYWFEILPIPVALIPQGVKTSVKLRHPRNDLLFFLNCKHIIK